VRKRFGSNTVGTSQAASLKSEAHEPPEATTRRVSWGAEAYVFARIFWGTARHIPQ
jgi:hypothetical protein